MSAGAWTAARRFPETLGLSVVAGGLAIYLTTPGDRAWELGRVLGTCLLGIPLSFAITTTWERPPARTAATLAAALLLGLHLAFTWQEPAARYVMRLVQVMVAAHLLVAFLPYAGRPPEGCWDWNARLFTRFTIAVGFSGIIVVGLSLSFATAHGLLDLPTPSALYLDLFLIVLFGFNTWFFLAGVPDPLPRQPAASYPRELRMLVQYVLIPLVTLYAGILYLYAGEMLVTRVWPRGTIGYIVSAFSLAALLTLLLGDPLRRDGAHRWLDRYARVLCAALVPLVVLLALGTWRRVAEYGLTERRYFLLALGAWIGATGIVIARTRRSDIRIVPASLFAVTALTAVGPWGAYAVSWRSQLGRLERVLREAQLLHGDRLAPPSTTVPLAQRREISSLLDYLNDVHGGAGLERWFEDAQVRAVARRATRRQPSTQGVDNPSIALMQSIGLTYAPGWRTSEEEPFTYGSAYDERKEPPLGVSGFYAIVTVQLSGNASRTVDWNGRSIVIALAPGDRELRVGDGHSMVVFDLAQAARALRAQPGGRFEPLVLDGVASMLAARVRLRMLSGMWSGTSADEVKIQSLLADVAFRTADRTD